MVHARIDDNTVVVHTYIDLRTKRTITNRTSANTLIETRNGVSVNNVNNNNYPCRFLFIAEQPHFTLILEYIIVLLTF